MTPPTRLPAVVWHASRTDIDRPTLAGRVAGPYHANSGLGLFCGTQPSNYLAGFGSTIFALTLNPESRVLAMDVPALRHLDQPEEERDRQWFEAEGRRLAADYDVIALMESSGSIDQVILLTDNAIVSAAKMSAETFLAEHAQERLPASPRRRPG